GAKSEAQHQSGADRQDAAAAGDIGIARNAWMPQGQSQHHGPEEPPRPKIFPEWNEREHCDHRNPAMQARRNGKYDVAAVELAARQQVERSSEHSYPCGGGDWMQRERGELHADVQQTCSQVESQWESQLNF